MLFDKILRLRMLLLRYVPEIQLMLTDVLQIQL